MKYNTSSLHERAETAFESNRPIDSQEGLSHFLSCMLGAHLRFFYECDTASKNAGLNPRSRSLIQALFNDLENSTTTIPPPIHRSRQFCAGVGYVFEGSALGANVILKRLNKSNIAAPNYLTQIATGTKHRWPLFLANLDTCSHKEDVLAGATTAFRFIIKEAESVKCLKVPN